MKRPILFWYRQDLRVQDLPGLIAAAATGRPVIPCYILDDATPGEWQIGSASRWWLHHSLKSLSDDLSQLGGTLILRRGTPLEEIGKLLRETNAIAVYCSRMYEPWAADLEIKLRRHVEDSGLTFKRFAGALLYEPESISNLSDKPYKVFTPFWRRCRSELEPGTPQKLEKTCWENQAIASDDLDDWQLLPKSPDWAAQWEHLWQPGSSGAAANTAKFLKDNAAHYSEGRDHPAKEGTTRLSPHLHYGEISPRQVWHQARAAAVNSVSLEPQIDKLFSEMGWREFSHHLVTHFPTIPQQAFKTNFRQFPWINDEVKLQAWKKGATGYPMVDAGMRELWQTGYMHNRVRMITASFLTKHLLIHWREGAKWFWDTLLDANLANNSCSWQWVAGSGADASPYFRIFNPVTQGKKFDNKGLYIRKWVPELSQLPGRYIHCPWEAPEAILEQAGITLGRNYPPPIVDHKCARESALAAYASLADASQ